MPGSPPGATGTGRACEYKLVRYLKARKRTHAISAAGGGWCGEGADAGAIRVGMGEAARGWGEEARGGPGRDRAGARRAPVVLFCGDEEGE